MDQNTVKQRAKRKNVGMDTTVKPLLPNRENEKAVDLLGPDSGGFALSILDSSPDCIKLVDLNGKLLFMNHNGQCAMEIDDFDIVSGANWPDLWPDDNQARVLASVRAAAEGRADRFEAYCPTAKGTPRWWDVSVAPVLGADGRPQHLVSISRDITDRVEREHAISKHERQLQDLALAQARTLEEKEELLREKTLLMQEVDHRVKNSLGMITSLLHLQGRVLDQGEAREALQRAANRVQTIASVHERLYRDGAAGEIDLGEYLQALCKDLDATISGELISLDVQMERPGTVVGKEAVTLGLIVTELVTNAARHACEDGSPCTIEVQCKPTFGGKRELIVEDNGCGLPDGFDPKKSRGLGMRVVQANIQRISADLRIERPEQGGTRFVVTF